MVARKGAATWQEYFREDKKSLFTKMADRFRSYRENRTGKPVGDIFYTGQEPRVQFPRLALPYWAMYETLYMCAPARTIVNHLISETFRNRGKWKESFAVKCGVCKLKMKHYPKNGKCERLSCKSVVMLDRDQPGIFGIPPDDDELAYANEKLERCNNAGEDIWGIMRQIALDTCAADDYYVICVKTYQKWPDGSVTGKVEELVRGHPNVIRIVSDDYGNRGGLYVQCPLHRTKVYTRATTGMMHAGDATVPAVTQSMESYTGWWTGAETAPERCEVKDERGRPCNTELRDIWYVGTDAGGSAPKQYYFEDECFHDSYFTPSILYGVSPIISMFRELRYLVKSAEYLQAYMEKRRIPRGVVAVNTPRKENILAIKQEFNKTADDNQQDIPFIAVEGSNSRGWIEFLPFADKINELELTALREELRNIIGGFYGVSPIFQGDMSQGGGLNNEGLQITVTNRSVETFQRFFSERLFKWLAKQFGITDHEFVLNPSEEKDFAHVHQLELLKLQVAQLKAQMGYRPLGVDEDGNYLFEDKPTPTHPAMLPFLSPKEQMMLQGGMAQQGQETPQGTGEPGGPQPKALPRDEAEEETDEATSRLHGEPEDVDGRGEASPA